jgi:hypothetical protein
MVEVSPRRQTHSDQEIKFLDGERLSSSTIPAKQRLEAVMRMVDIGT